jgi:hypothetical protein
LGVAVQLQLATGKSISKNIEIQYTRVTPDREN